MQKSVNKMHFELKLTIEVRPRKVSFWEAGWGVRDVRGPYLNASEGRICISPWALSPSKPSVISLQFGMSNRELLQAVSLQATGEFRVRSCFVERNKSSELLIKDILGQEQNVYFIFIIHPTLPQFSGCLFNAHYDERCFLPIHVYDTERIRRRRRA
jgi:hypothetical protein